MPPQDPQSPEAEEHPREEPIEPITRAAQREHEPGEGPVDGPTIRAALPSLEPALLRCAALARSSNPNVIGRITVRGVVLRDGRVAQLQTAEADLPDAAAIACSLDATADLKLPAKPEGTTRFSAQVSFAPN